MKMRLSRRMRGRKNEPEIRKLAWRSGPLAALLSILAKYMTAESLTKTQLEQGQSEIDPLAGVTL